MKGYLYIHYYTVSTIDLERRLAQHCNGEGANFTRKHLPVQHSPGGTITALNPGFLQLCTFEARNL